MTRSTALLRRRSCIRMSSLANAVTCLDFVVVAAADVLNGSTLMARLNVCFQASSSQDAKQYFLEHFKLAHGAHPYCRSITQVLSCMRMSVHLGTLTTHRCMHVRQCTPRHAHHSMHVQQCTPWHVDHSPLHACATVYTSAHSPQHACVTVYNLAR